MGRDGSVVVRAAEERDREPLLALLADCFPDLSVERERERQRWYRERNPVHDPRVPLAWVAEREGRLVGTYGVLARRFLVDGEVRAGLLGTDFCVRPELRGHGLGRALTDAFVATPGSTVRLISSPTPAVIGLFRARGGSVVDPDAERALLARPVRGADDDPDRGADDGLTLASVTEFGPEFDALARALGRQHRVMVLRDAAYLDWRYARDPYVRHVALAAREGDRLVGFCVVTLAQSQAQGFLSEWFAAPEDLRVAGALLDTAARVAAERGLVALTALERRPAWRELLVARGWAPIDAGVPDAALLITDAPRPVEDWFLGPGDCDVLFRIGGD